MSREKTEREAPGCPVGRFFSDLEKLAGKKSVFQKHLKTSRLEFLKAVRSLVDERIEHMEKEGSKRAKKRVTKINVE